MNTARLVTRVGALGLLLAAVVLAVAAGSGLVEGSVLEALLSGGTSSTAVLLSVLGLVLAVLLGGGVWAYERLAAGPRGDGDAADEAVDDEPAGFGDYESFEAFVAAGGLEREGLARARDEAGDRTDAPGEGVGRAEPRSDLVASGERRDDSPEFVVDLTAFEDAEDVVDFYETWDGSRGHVGNGTDHAGNGAGDAANGQADADDADDESDSRPR